jgi:trigger factor
MQDIINIEELNNTEYKISINVPSELVDKKFDQFFNSIKNQIQIPGFRKGRAPLQRIKQLFGNKAKSNVAQMLISEYYNQAIANYEINPVENPTFSDMSDKYPGKFGFDNSYSVDLLVEVLPKIDPIGYNGIKLDFPQYDEDAMFNTKLHEYQKQFAERRQINDRGAQFGDSLVIDFIGYVDNMPFDGGAAQGYSIENFGNGNFVPGFEDQMVDMMVGQSKDIYVTFPDEYRAKHLAGKEAKFTITVHSIIEIKLAEVDNDLAMMVGYESVDELFNYIKSELHKDNNINNRTVLGEQIVSKLLDINQFDAPKSMIKKEMLRISGKNKLQDLSHKDKDELQKIAERSVKCAILLDSIYEKENSIEITPDELDKLLEDHARHNNMSKDDLVSNLYNSGQMDNFMGILKTSNTIDFIINNANKESEESNVDRNE